MALNDNDIISEYPFLFGGGEMGSLIRSVDWSETPLGPPANWPTALKQTASMMLTTPFPVLICWGKNYIQLYNDAFRPILGVTKHPRALGISASDTYAEIWETIGPMFNNVINGQAVSFPNFMVSLDRNGYLEDCYFDFSYSPIRDEQGCIDGILVICIETTDKVRSLEILEQNQKVLKLQTLALAKSEDNFRNIIIQSPVAMGLFTGRDMVLEVINDSFISLWGKDKSILGKPLLVALPELVSQPYLQIMQNVMDTGKTYYGNESKVLLHRNGVLDEGYYNFINHPFENARGEITGIIVVATEVTEQVYARNAVQAINEELKIANDKLISSNNELALIEQNLQDVVYKLIESEEKFRLLADNISQLAWMTDETGYIFWYNKQWYDYTGTTFEDMEGWAWKSVHHPDHIDEVTEKWKAHIDSGEVFEYTFPLRSKNGEYRWFLTRAVPLKDGSGKVQRWFGTNTDITEQRALVRQKDDFISIASHELKTPITSLKASLQLLNKIKDDPSAAILPKLVEQANRSTDKVSVLIEDLLNASKFNQGQLYLNKKVFTLSKIIDDCCNYVRMTGAHDIITTGETDLQVYADAERIEQVIINIVNNAIKYAPEIKDIYVFIEKTANMAKVSVHDDGPGIPAEKLPHLFDRYFRVDNSGVQYSGLGLGLYICAEIIKKHNGQIGVESEPGKGSTFWFTLPLL